MMLWSQIAGSEIDGQFQFTRLISFDNLDAELSTQCEHTCILSQNNAPDALNTTFFAIFRHLSKSLAPAPLPCQRLPTRIADAASFDPQEGFAHRALPLLPYLFAGTNECYRIGRQNLI